MKEEVTAEPCEKHVAKQCSKCILTKGKQMMGGSTDSPTESDTPI